MVVSKKDAWKPLRDIVEGLGYECVGIALASEEKALFLRVFIDSVGGILVRDCEIVSKALSAFLDENEDIVQGKFFLEVSSPGIERPLFTPADYARFIGRKARVKTKAPVAGRKSFTGALLSLEDDVLSLEPENDGSSESEVVRIPFEAISKGNLVFEEKKDKRRNS